jgi:class 3 adenylate cyclase
MDGEKGAETIVIVDMVGSTHLASRLGWDLGGKPMVSALRAAIDVIGGSGLGLACRKFTGDGYMLTFDTSNTFDSLPCGIRAIVEISQDIAKWNARNRNHRIKLRFSIHFGGIERYDNDREGLEIAFAFRLEGVDSIDKAWGTDPAVKELPEHDYAIMSDAAVELLQSQNVALDWYSLGAIPIKSFGRREIFLLRDVSSIVLP